MTTTTVGSVFAQLARQEITGYARARLFWVGAVLTAVVIALDLRGPNGPNQGSTSLDGIGPAAALGVLGIVVMAGRVRESDLAAAAAGAVSVSERTRTLALATAALVPLLGGLIWYAAAVYAWFRFRSDASGPFGPANDSFVLVSMLCEGVIPCLGGPLLGLVVGRWLGRRWIAIVTAAAIVPVTMVFQGGLVDAVTSWRLVWVWTHFHGPAGIVGDDMRWVIFPGSPYFFALYQLALCVLGVLFAAYHDSDADRGRLRKACWVTVVAAVVLCGLAITGGVDDYVVNPIPSVNAGNGSDGLLDIGG